MTSTRQFERADPRHDVRLGDAATRLRAAHLTAAECVAGLSLDDRRLWARVAPIVSAISRNAYDVSATIRGESPVPVAVAVPPVVRARELGCAQARLFGDLASCPGVLSEVLEASAAEVARLVRRIRESQAAGA